MTGDGTGSRPSGLTEWEVLLEMRADLRALNITVEAIAKDQALGVERRAGVQRATDHLSSRCDQHDREIDDLRRWRDRADGAMVLARWALGASLISLLGVAMQAVAAIAKAIDPSLP